MRVGPAASVCLLGAIFVGCATGTAADDSSSSDSGTKQDSSIGKDSSLKDSTPPKDTGGSIDTGGGNCGSGCLGLASTCCNNTCVDITADKNNCGGCGNPCGTQDCCAGNCVDTMGSDTANCGGCGVTCNGTCTNGTCQTQGGSCTLDKGTCSHSPCATGGALQDGCDPEFVTIYVCDFDGLSNCCTSSWDQSCVDDAAFWESNGCVGQGC
jgi:hypothetical protein